MVDVVFQFDHQATQRALDMGLGHPGNPANRLLDHRGVFVPAGERQQRVEVQVDPLPLCQRTGGRMVSAEPLVEVLIPSARPVESATDCTTGPASSATGLANSWTAPAAPAAVDTPARIIWAAPPVTSATTLDTPGIFIQSPFNYVYRLMILASHGPVHSSPG